MAVGEETRIGSLVGNGKYEITDFLGAGSQSKVWLAKDRNLDGHLTSKKFWAVKEVNRDGVDKNGLNVYQSLIAEADMLTKLDHPTLPRILDVIEESGRIFVVMDYIPGDNLAQMLKKRQRPMDEEDLIILAKQLCEVLQYLHTREKPIIYRDMKPSNIMWNDNRTAKLLDFGIAREYKELKSQDTVAGFTPDYAAPEQLGSSAQSDARTDIYCLGATLYHLITGKNPSRKPFIIPIREWNPQLSEGLEYIINKATQRNPDNRYQSCAEMLYDLDHYEELTESHRNAQKAKVARFRGLVIAAVVFAIIGVGLMIGSHMMKTSTFDYYIEQAELAGTDEIEGEASDAERDYTSAIEIEPSNIDAYISLVTSVYKADSSFSVTESERWAKLFSNNHSSIEGDSKYAELCYEVGILYFIYYDYGDEMTRGSSAAQWFNYAVEAYDANPGSSTLTEQERSAAAIYVTIGQFYQVLSQASAEGRESSVYTDYWTAFENACDVITSDDQVVIQLRLYQVIWQALNSPNYLTGFMKAGITQDQVFDMLDLIESRTSELELSADAGDLTSSMYQSIIDGYESAKSNIQYVYGETGTSEGEEA